MIGGGSLNDAKIRELMGKSKEISLRMVLELLSIDFIK